jgi:hypothetical protein
MAPIALASRARLRTRRSRKPTNVKAACRSIVFTGTSRIVGALICSKKNGDLIASHPKSRYVHLTCGLVSERVLLSPRLALAKLLQQQFIYVSGRRTANKYVEVED